MPDEKEDKTVRKHGIAKAINIITTVALIVVIVLTLLFVGGRLFGYQTYAVISGSMEPIYPVFSAIYVRPVSPEDVRVGDPITFRLSAQTVATHRVVEIDAANRRFITQGDQNDYRDAPISFDSLIGKPIFAIPYIGLILLWVSDPPGRYLAIAAVALLVLLCILPEVFGSGKKPAAPSDDQKSAPE